MRATLKAIQIIFDEGRVIQAQIQHPFPLDLTSMGLKPNRTKPFSFCCRRHCYTHRTIPTIIVINEAKQSKQFGLVSYSCRNIVTWNVMQKTDALRQRRFSRFSFFCFREEKKWRTRRDVIAMMKLSLWYCLIRVNNIWNIYELLYTSTDDFHSHFL